MAEDMSIADYLAAGGKLTSPTNAPPRYRAELLRLMATFVDSELAGAAGFADMINSAPGIKERIAAAKIVLEKTAHAGRVLKIMGEFGVDQERYANSHPWAARLERSADIGARRSAHDMRLAVFNYPLTGWTDAVVMNLLMGKAVAVQLQDFAKISYQPLAEEFRKLAPAELRHTELAEEGLAKIIADAGGQAEAQASIDYWRPRVAVSFGAASTQKTESLKAMGLRAAAGEAQRARWGAACKAALEKLGLTYA